MFSSGSRFIVPRLLCSCLVHLLDLALVFGWSVAPAVHAPHAVLGVFAVAAMLWVFRAAPLFRRCPSAMTAPLLRWEKLEYDRGRAERGRVASARKVSEKRIERLLVDAGKAKDDHERERIRAEIQHEKDTMPAELRAPRLFTEDVTAERLQAMLAEYGERMALLSDEAGIFQIMAGIYNGGALNLSDCVVSGNATNSATPRRSRTVVNTLTSVSRSSRAGHSSGSARAATAPALPQRPGQPQARRAGRTPVPR